MKTTNSVLAIVLLIITTSCFSQHTQKMDKQNNPLLCDPNTGICEVPYHQSENDSNQVKSENKAIKIIYFTDPICSSCWGIEAQLRKLKLEYGESIDLEYRMGGLLPDWNYNSGGISKPSDVAHHWDEVSLYYDMPIDGDVWLENPLNSSYPPSIAFKAAQLQDKQKAFEFLRELRELVFLHKKNITEWEQIKFACQEAGLDVTRLKTDCEFTAKSLFEDDLKLSKSLGVRGFPTLIFIDSLGNKETIYGAQSYSKYETMVLKLDKHALKSTYSKEWKSLFAKFPSLTAKEFSELSGMPRAESELFLNNLHQEGKLEIFTTKNGSIWKLKTKH